MVAEVDAMVLVLFLDDESFEGLCKCPRSETAVKDAPNLIEKNI